MGHSVDLSSRFHIQDQCDRITSQVNIDQTARADDIRRLLCRRLTKSVKEAGWWTDKDQIDHRSRQLMIKSHCRWNVKSPGEEWSKSIFEKNELFYFSNRQIQTEHSGENGIEIFQFLVFFSNFNVTLVAYFSSLSLLTKMTKTQKCWKWAWNLTNLLKIL